jgi:glycosyltransferase involved in cell wall biosynthesis
MARPAAAVSAVVHTRNSALTLKRTLDSVAWANEIIVVDMESDDGTRDIAAAANARILDVPLHPRVDGVRNHHLSKATHEWILVIDSDEYLASDAQLLINETIAEHGQAFDAFAIPRFNWFGDRLLRGSGWYPDHQIRLFRKGTVAWSDSTHRPPEVLTGNGRLQSLTPPGCLHIHHLNYVDLGHFISKQVAYACNDIYPGTASDFSFEEYVAEAFLEYRRRLDRENDGDYSVALATIMAWDKIIRGLIHWDRLGRTTELPDIFSLPIVLKPNIGPTVSLRSRLKRVAKRILRRRA